MLQGVSPMSCLSRPSTLPLHIEMLDTGIFRVPGQIPLGFLVGNHVVTQRGQVA